MKVWYSVGWIALVAGVCGVAWGWRADLKPEVWAAWVQAYFSVVAIGAAVAVAQWGRGEDHRLEAERERSLAYCKMDMVVALADRAVATIQSVPRALGTTDDAIKFGKTYDAKETQLLVLALQAIGPADVTTGDALVTVLNLRGELEHAGRLLEAKFSLFLAANVDRNWVLTADAVHALEPDAVAARDKLRLERDRWAKR